MRLLVRCFPMTSCTLANSAIGARARVRSSSRALPISYKAWRQIVCTRSNIPCIMSYHSLPGRSFSVVLCLPWERFARSRYRHWGYFHSSDPSSRRNTACLASHRSRSWSCTTGRTRSEAVFQWSLDSGLRVIANFGPWKSSRGRISGTYSNRGEELSPKRQEKPTRRVRSSPGCWVKWCGA